MTQNQRITVLASPGGKSQRSESFQAEQPKARRGDWWKCVSWEQLARSALFSAKEMAVRCGVSQRQLQRHFHDHAGLKLHEWLNDLRLKDAQHLVNKNTQVKEVAYLLGYKSSEHFIRRFKIKYGMSPQKFARLNSERVQNPQVRTLFEAIGHNDPKCSPPAC